MRRSRRSSWDTAARRTLLACSAVIRTRSSRGAAMWPSCQRMRPRVASEKKGGRRKASLADRALLPMLAAAVQDHTAGSPVEPGQLWTNRSPAELARELAEQGHPVNPKTVRRMLQDDLGLSRRQMVKTLSMGESADREAQFQRLQKIKSEFLERGFPVVSIDTKKKELLGKFYRSGPAWTNGRVRAWDHDFPSSSWGKVIGAVKIQLQYLGGRFVRRFWWPLAVWAWNSRV